MKAKLRTLFYVVVVAAGGGVGGLIAIANRWGADFEECRDTIDNSIIGSCAAPQAAAWAISAAVLCGLFISAVLVQVLRALRHQRWKTDRPVKHVGVGSAD